MSAPMTAREAVLKILVEELCVNREQLVDNATLDDLGADSLDILEVVDRCEAAFGRTIPDEDTANFKTVGDIIRYVEAAPPTGLYDNLKGGN